MSLRRVRRHFVLTFVAAGLVALLSACKQPLTISGAAAALCSDSSSDSELKIRREELCGLVNSARVGAAIAGLSLDAALSAVAQAHAQDMIDRSFFSHDNPEGLSPFDRMNAAGISYSAAGENIAMGQSTSADVMSSWMNSPGHRANILQPGFGKIGIGYAVSAAGEAYWVQDFTN